jgi:hypothetical protein
MLNNVVHPGPAKLMKVNGSGWKFALIFLAGLLVVCRFFLTYNL